MTCGGVICELTPSRTLAGVIGTHTRLPRDLRFISVLTFHRPAIQILVQVIWRLKFQEMPEESLWENILKAPLALENKPSCLHFQLLFCFPKLRLLLPNSFPISKDWNECVCLYTLSVITFY